MIEKNSGTVSARKLAFIAEIRHMGWVTYQIAAGQKYNEEINNDQLESLIDGIEFLTANPDTTPETNHNNWMREKERQGWVYGSEKNFDKKTHPDLVPFDELPEIEKRKDIADMVSHRLALRMWEKITNNVMDPNE